MARVNENYIAKISTKFKAIVNQSYERFQETAEMLYGLTILFTSKVNYLQQSGKLDFALLQMIQQVSDLINTVRCFKGSYLGT